jgi:hypothetical protein
MPKHCRIGRGFRITALVTMISLPIFTVYAQLPSYGVGLVPSPEEIEAWDLTIPPDGEGLPTGSGTATLGKEIYMNRCASCHGQNGEDSKYYALVGGRGTLATNKPEPTVGSFWQFSTTLWSYMRRSKPIDEPGSFNADEVYSVTAYLLYLNEIIGKDKILDATTLPQIRMPNRDGYVPDPRPDVVNASESTD